MPRGHAVVDGSNIATEGRSEPSLSQLREALTEFVAENDFRYVTVIVDASFEHRVSAREKKAARTAIDEGEMIMPPAGVVGRGDAFILEVADRAGAVVLSNDSFQEFHGTYAWLFDEGRLIGGKPVPGVGWVYVARTPVRGPVSRRATKSTSSAKKPAKAAKATKTPAKKAARRTKKSAPAKTPAPADTQATKKTTRSGSTPRSGANTVKVWREFRRDYPVGSTVAATVDRFSSHGAYGSVGKAVVYLPSRLLGDPPPTRARDVLSIGETRDFVVDRFDDDRRGIDLGLGSQPQAAKKVAKKTTKATAKKATKKPATKKKASAKKATKRRR